MTLEEKKQKVSKLRPIDDVFFEVLADDTAVMQEILRVILEDEELTVTDVIVQSSERNLYGRSVRLDALCTLGNGRHCNVEVQRANNDDHFRRVRFNASSITVKESSEGTDFKDIIDLYIVFISEKDFIGENKTIYHIDKTIRETGTIIDDGLTEIFINAAVKDGSDISELMECFKQENVDNPKFPALTKRVSDLKYTEGGLNSMCEVMEYYENIAEEKGRAEGLEEGLEKGGNKMLYELVQDGTISVLKAAKKLQLSEKEFIDKMTLCGYHLP